jgi:predicted nucleic acid-binding protein
MSSSSFPIDTDTILVADASVIINLNATGRAFDIIRAYRGSVVVTGKAFAELVAGARNGHSDAKKLQVLVDSGAVRLVELGEVGNLVYSSLVEGSATRTLEDGEAATIGYAHEIGAVAMIDERKARSICANEYPGLKVLSTVDLLAHDVIGNALGKEGQINAILNALRDARMRVPSHQIEMIVNLIGDEAAATCYSLPRAVRATGNSERYRE